MKSTHIANLNINHLPITLPKTLNSHLSSPNSNTKPSFLSGNFATPTMTSNSSHRRPTSAKIKSKRKLVHVTHTKKVWILDIPHSPKNDSIPQVSLQANNAYTQKILRDLVSYLHQAAFSPVPSTWIKAIYIGFFST